MTNILSQEEVDALLRGISGGEIDTQAEEYQEPGVIVPYDLTSQDRITRGRMPTLEMTNEKFARLFRTTISSLLRKVISVTAVSTDMTKFGEFLKTLPVPTSLHLFRMDPMRGSAIFVVESKIIFTLVDIIFGGSGTEAFKIEGREFTAIENNLIKKVVLSALSDLEKCWQQLLPDLKIAYQYAEINPQFVQIVPQADVVVVMNFEIEMEYTSGVISICIPYSMLEPIKEKLSAGFQSEQLEVDKVWTNRVKSGLLQSWVNIFVELGRAQIFGKDIINLKKGDVIQLEHYASDPLDIYVEEVKKFKGYPGNYKGNQAVQISSVMMGKEETDMEQNKIDESIKGEGVSPEAQAAEGDKMNWDDVKQEMEESKVSPQTRTEVTNVHFDELKKKKSDNKSTFDLDFILDIPLTLTCELGRSKMLISELLQLGQGSVLELTKLAGEPMDIYVNQRLIARGEVVVVNEKFGVRLTDIVSPTERVNKLV